MHPALLGRSQRTPRADWWAPHGDRPARPGPWLLTRSHPRNLLPCAPSASSSHSCMTRSCCGGGSTGAVTSGSELDIRTVWETIRRSCSSSDVGELYPSRTAIRLWPRQQGVARPGTHPHPDPDRGLIQLIASTARCRRTRPVRRRSPNGPDQWLPPGGTARAWSRSERNPPAGPDRGQTRHGRQHHEPATPCRSRRLLLPEAVSGATAMGSP